MYGKIFCSMYEGSMVGSGPVVFAVWGYCIAKADFDDHTVLLNPQLIAGIIGTTTDAIELAVTFLTAPDLKSKNQDHEGRRLLHQSGFSYLVVSHEHYREIRNRADVREYERVRKQNQRRKNNVPDSPGQHGTPVSVSESYSKSKKGSPEGKPITPTDKVTWLTPYFDAWKKRFGGTLPPKFYSTLKSYQELHGLELALRAFTSYIAKLDDMKFASPPTLAAGSPELWTGNGKVKNVQTFAEMNRQQQR